MKHYNIHGKLCHGYYCCWCGKSVGMIGHSLNDRETGVCVSNIKLVIGLDRANPLSPKKPHFVLKLDK